MTISMSSASLPLFRTMLGNLSHVLDKGAAHAAAKKFDPAALLQARLAPECFLSHGRFTWHATTRKTV